MSGKELGIRRYFYIQRLAFRALGIDVTSVDNILQQSYRFWIPCVCANMIICCTFYYIWENAQEMEKATDSLAVALQTCLGVWKISLFVYNRKAIVLMVREILLLSAKATEEERLNIAEENSRDKLFSYFYSVSVLMTAGTFLVVPNIFTAVIYIRSEELQFFIPFKASYPIDQTRPLNYLVLFCWNVGAVYIVSIGSTAVESLYSWLVHNIAAQFRLVQLQLKEAANKSEDSETEIAIKRSIRQHQCALTLSAEFNRTFQMIVFLEFAITGVQVCLVAFRLTSGLARESVPFLIAFCGALVMQMVIYCYGGQRMQDESGLIADYINEVFPWHSISVDAKKLLLLPIMRAQKPCSLTGVFFLVNWTLFIWVVKTNASYVTLLWSMDDKAAGKI